MAKHYFVTFKTKWIDKAYGDIKKEDEIKDLIEYTKKNTGRKDLKYTVKYAYGIEGEK